MRLEEEGSGDKANLAKGHTMLYSNMEWGWYKHNWQYKIDCNEFKINRVLKGGLFF